MYKEEYGPWTCLVMAVVPAAVLMGGMVMLTVMVLMVTVM